MPELPEELQESFKDIFKGSLSNTASKGVLRSGSELSGLTGMSDSKDSERYQAQFLGGGEAIK